MRAFGASEEDVAAWVEAQDADEDRDDDSFEVLPENWDTVRVFEACQTQWNFAGMAGVRTGIHYPAVESALRMMKIAGTDTVFDDLRIMEDAALRAMHGNLIRTRYK